MPDPTNSNPTPLPPAIELHDHLADRLDGLGRALATREATEPPPRLLGAMKARRTRPLALRLGLLAAAGIALAAGLYTFTRPAPPAGSPQITANPPANRTSVPIVANLNSPTLATLRKLNPDPAADALRFPAAAATSAPAIPARPTDAHDPGALARIAGPGR